MGAVRPRVVLVTGAPGSGKTSLGTRLARELRVPFLARDDVRGGLMFTAGAWTDEMDGVPSADDAVEAFLQTVEGLLGRGVSLVAEYVVRTHRPEDLERLMAAGDCMVLVTSCDDALGRVTRRNSADPLVARPAFLRAAGFATVDEHTEAVVARMRQVEREMRVDFPVPTLIVDTSGRDEPDLGPLVRFVTATSSS